jgi:hypothetical protein
MPLAVSNLGWPGKAKRKNPTDSVVRPMHNPVCLNKGQMDPWNFLTAEKNVTFVNCINRNPDNESIEDHIMTNHSSFLKKETPLASK